MPVYKYRDVSEMPDEQKFEPGSVEHIRRMKDMWEFARVTNPRSFPPGVYKHRTIESAQAQREAWLRQHVESGRT